MMDGGWNNYLNKFAIAKAKGREPALEEPAVLGVSLLQLHKEGHVVKQIGCSNVLDLIIILQIFDTKDHP
jgi:hypothetical protein